MKNVVRILRGLCLALCVALPIFTLSPVHVHADGPTVNVWVTNPDLSLALSQQAPISFNNANTGDRTLYVDDTRTYQSWDGVGGTMTDSSAWLIENRLNSDQRNALMNNLFGYGDSALGLNFIRVPMGASDFSVSGNYSYDDNGPDPQLNNFSTSHDDAYLIPSLQQAQQINGAIKFLGSPWSAPGWMKNGGSGSLNLNGGSFNSDYADSLANYIARFVQDYNNKGVSIWGITPQNEPQNSGPNYPTMYMSASQQADLIANHLGPALANLGLGTKILIYDHNWGDQGGGTVSYPQDVLSNSQAYNYITGTAFHCYNGDSSGQKVVQNAYPGKDIYFDECTQTADNSHPFQSTMDLVVRVPRNAGKTVTLFNLALDTNYGPQNNGCSNCRALVTIDQNTGNVTYNQEYYALGHISKFVQRGAVNIATDDFGSGNIRTVGFLNPDNSKVLIAYNDGTSATTFNISWQGQTFSYTLNGGAAATFVWS